MRQSPTAPSRSRSARAGGGRPPSAASSARRVALDGDVELARRPPRSRSRTAPPTRCTPPPARRGVEQRGAARQARQGVAQIGHRRRTIYHQVAMSPPRRRKRLWWLVAGAVVAPAPGRCRCRRGRLRSGEGDVSNPDVAFEETTESVPVAPDPSSLRSRSPASRRAIPSDDGFSWPFYGYSKSRTHYLPVRSALRPPFRAGVVGDAAACCSSSRPSSAAGGCSC